jgi:hypothetical protein
VPLYALRLGGDASLVGLLAGTGALADVPGGLIAGRIAVELANGDWSSPRWWRSWRRWLSWR